MEGRGSGSFDVFFFFGSVEVLPGLPFSGYFLCTKSFSVTMVCVLAASNLALHSLHQTALCAISMAIPPYPQDPLILS